MGQRFTSKGEADNKVVNALEAAHTTQNAKKDRV
jgi:hypothetical protein